MSEPGGRRLSEDDKAVLAMDASRMSVDSIAATVGWSRRRVVARLAVLKIDPAAAGAAVGPAVTSIGAIAAAVARSASEQRQQASLSSMAQAFSRLVSAIPAMAGEQTAAGLARLIGGLPSLSSIIAVDGMTRCIRALPRLSGLQAVRGLRVLSDGLGRLPAPADRAPAPVRPVAVNSLLGGARPPVGRLTPGRTIVAKPPRPERRAKVRRPVRSASALGERRGVERLKPLNDARLRYCRWFHDAGWPVEEIARLFDTPEGDLAQALGAVH